MKSHCAFVTGSTESRLPRASSGEAFELVAILELGKRNHALQLALVFDVDERPARLLALARGVVVIALPVELRRIGIRALRDFGDAGDAGHFAARVIEQHAVAGLHSRA